MPAFMGIEAGNVGLQARSSRSLPPPLPLQQGCQLLRPVVQVRSHDLALPQPALCSHRRPDAQQAATLSVKPLKGGVYWIEGRVGNTGGVLGNTGFIVGQNGVIVIDAKQNAELAKAMLAEIAKDLPPQVTLRELTIIEETSKLRARSGVVAVGVKSQPATGQTPAKADLDLLRSQQDRSRAEIQISGTTTDSGAVHLFVMALNGTPLFESAKLYSMEAVTGSKQAQSNFFIRLTARPGYGQPGGPQAPPPAIATQASSKRSYDRS